MIDLTPLDVRKKKGDFRRVMRGYDADAVDNFLDEVVARMEELVRENQALGAKAAQMTEAIADYRERERAMNDALVGAQQLREATREQAQREADLVLRRAFAATRELCETAARQVPGFRGQELSMGMSNDFEIAGEEGATLVRVGSSICGERG